MVIGRASLPPRTFAGYIEDLARNFIFRTESQCQESLPASILSEQLPLNIRTIESRGTFREEVRAEGGQIWRTDDLPKDPFKMKNNQYVAICLVALVMGQAAALPQHPEYHPQQFQQQVREERKFAEKPNAMKKVSLDDLDDISSNQIQESSGSGFSWSNMLGTLMQMLLGQAGSLTGSSKNEIDDGAPASPWTNLLSVGLRVLTALLGGPQQPSDGIDKVDNPSSPMQGILTAVLGAFLGQGRDPDQVAVMAKNASEFISIVIDLLDALKTSFSHRSRAARSLGKGDTVSDAALASIALLKGYMRSMKSINDVDSPEDDSQRTCVGRALCDANVECLANVDTKLLCQFGLYATSYAIQKYKGVELESIYKEGRLGRTSEECKALYMDCYAL